MLQTLTTISQDDLMVLLWIAICAGVALLTVVVLTAQRLQLAMTRRAVIKKRMARIVAGG